MKGLVFAILTWTVLGGIGFFLVDSFIAPYFSGKYQEKVVVPNGIGKNLDDFTRQLQSSGLQFVLDSTAEYSLTIEAGKITKQRPIAGSVVKKDRRVWITVSRGRNNLEVPDFNGQTLRQVEISLQQLGLTLGKIEKEPAPVPENTIHRTDPPAFSTVRVGATIDVFVGSGEITTETILPQFYGVSLNKAKEKLIQLGVEVQEVKSEKSDLFLPNTVINQIPEAGTPIFPQLKVVLIVSE